MLTNSVGKLLGLTMSIMKMGAAAGLALAFAAGAAIAAPVAVSSYSMNNGAHGSFNYRDFTYSNCAGVCDVTNAALSGGVGKLTDGVSPALSWYQYGENTPWVGWDVAQGQTNPSVSFSFAGVTAIDSVTIWVDNSIGAGGVYLPASVTINGVNHLIAADNVNPLPRALIFSGLGILDDNVDITFFQTSGYPWLMVGEVSFDGGGAVPEPATWALMLMGFGGLGLALRSRRRLVAA